MTHRNLCVIDASLRHRIARGPQGLAGRLPPTLPIKGPAVRSWPPLGRLERLVDAIQLRSHVPNPGIQTAWVDWLIGHDNTR